MSVAYTDSDVEETDRKEGARVVMISRNTSAPSSSSNRTSKFGSVWTIRGALRRCSKAAHTSRSCWATWNTIIISSRYIFALTGARYIRASNTIVAKRPWRITAGVRRRARRLKRARRARVESERLGYCARNRVFRTNSSTRRETSCLTKYLTRLEARVPTTCFIWPDRLNVVKAL